MADLHLIRPDAGSVQSVSGRGDVRFVFDFPPGEAVFSREGNDLLLSFDDGAVLRLQDFYLVSSAESVPSFEVDGAEITGKDFLLSMNGADLMPAAGNAREAWKGNGNRFHDYQDATLSGSVTLAGLDRLEGLDVDWEAEASSPPAEGPAAGSFVDVDHGVTVSSQGSLTVHESGLAGGSSPGVKPTTASGSLAISAPDGVAAIAIGGTTVYGKGALTGRTVSTDGGSLEVTFFATVTGEVKYSYLGEPFSFAVTVTDADGSEGTCSITVTNGDDGADGTSSATAGLTFALPAEEAEGVASLAMSTEDDASAFSGVLPTPARAADRTAAGRTSRRASMPLPVPELWKAVLRALKRRTTPCQTAKKCSLPEAATGFPTGRPLSAFPAKRRGTGAASWRRLWPTVRRAALRQAWKGRFRWTRFLEATPAGGARKRSCRIPMRSA